MDKKKPILIILEGPAGAGKTTIQEFLLQSLKSQKKIIDVLPEFSKNKLGQLIKNNCQYGQEKPKWLTGISGLMLFLVDKINKIDKATIDGNKIWICDRFITTEFILGFNMINQKEDNLLAHEIVQNVYKWSLKKISKQSVFIFLDCSFDILKNRLEKRIARKLTQSELYSLDNEISGYSQLAKLLNCPNILVVDSNSSVSIVGDKIINHLSSKYQL